MLTTIITIIHIFICLCLIGIVLLQQGKGADMGATFGGGGGTLFGASGADNFLTRVTTITAILFMITSVFLAVSMRERASTTGSLFQSAPQKQAPAAPAPAGAPVEPDAGEQPAAQPEQAAPQAAAPQPAAPAAPLAEQQPAGPPAGQ